jgi:Immunoglobulin I-set domain
VQNGVVKFAANNLNLVMLAIFRDLDSRFLLIGTSTLQISNVHVRDAGTYQCRAENKEDSLDAMANLDVQGTNNLTVVKIRLLPTSYFSASKVH